MYTLPPRIIFLPRVGGCSFNLRQPAEFRVATQCSMHSCESHSRGKAVARGSSQTECCVTTEWSNVEHEPRLYANFRVLRDCG
jgi:hypothetical protein